MLRARASQRSTSKSTYGSRSVLLTTTRSAAANIPGYFSGLSSPSVTEMTTTLRDSPRANSAGQTRLPTFSSTTTPPAGGCSSSSARRTIDASRWQPAPVLTCTASAPAARIRLASNSVSWSPSTTDRVSPDSRIVRSSREVLPEPGELIRLTAQVPRASSQSRLRAASSSLRASTLTSSSTVWVRATIGTCSWSWLWSWPWLWPWGWSWSWSWRGRGHGRDPLRRPARWSPAPRRCRTRTWRTSASSPPRT